MIDKEIEKKNGNNIKQHEYFCFVLFGTLQF